MGCAGWVAFTWRVPITRGFDRRRNWLDVCLGADLISLGLLFGFLGALGSIVLQKVSLSTTAHCPGAMSPHLHFGVCRFAHDPCCSLRKFRCAVGREATHRAGLRLRVCYFVVRGKVHDLTGKGAGVGCVPCPAGSFENMMSRENVGLPSGVFTADDLPLVCAFKSTCTSRNRVCLDGQGGRPQSAWNVKKAVRC